MASRKKRVLSVAAIVLISISVCAVGFFSIFGYVFGVQPKHVVEKDGRKMVACVDSYLQVIVRYYDYKNPFIRGKQIRRYEDYGNGGYDPFDYQYGISVKRYTIYDDNGKIIESSENNN